MSNVPSARTAGHLSRGWLSPEKQKERERLRAKGLNFDVVGFLLIATFLGGLEVGLPRDAVAKVLGIEQGPSETISVPPRSTSRVLHADNPRAEAWRR
jgi:hypothetical protein